MIGESVNQRAPRRRLRLAGLRLDGLVARRGRVRPGAWLSTSPQTSRVSKSIRGSIHGVGEVGDQVHHQPEQREDVERREHHRIVAVEHRLEAEQPQPVEREDRLDQQRAGEEGADEGARKSGDDDQHGVAEDVAVEHLPVGQPLGPRRHHVLLADLVEERVLGQQRRGREGGKRHRRQRQHQVPEVVEERLRVGHPLPERHVDVAVGPQAAQREDVPERAAGEQDDQQDREQEPGDGVADDDHRRGPHVEARALLDRLAHAERDRDRVGEQRHPQAERDRHRHLLADQLEHADVAEVALAEIEARVVPQHQAEALQRRLVEAELLLELLDELRVEPLRAAVFRGDRLRRRRCCRWIARRRSRRRSSR